MMKVELSGLEAFVERARASPERAKAGAIGSMKLMVTKAKNEAQQAINVKADFPSAAGEPPHRVTGHLIKNLYGRVEEDGNIVTGVIGDSAEYAELLEFGTSKMEPRPFIRPAVDGNVDFFQRLMEAVLSKI